MDGTTCNVFACIVHEAPECILDLVANLRYLDPDSVVLLYDGAGPDGPVASLGFGAERAEPGVVVHPHPAPVQWGRLDEAAVACMRAALELGATAITFVDSDQLAIRPGYSSRLATRLGSLPAPGCLVSAPGVQPSSTLIGPAQAAINEVDLWLPFLRRFPDGEAQFPHWTFWPGSAFSGRAAAAVVALWDTPAFRDTLGRSAVWASEEVFLPTLAALAGCTLAANEFTERAVRYRREYSTGEVAEALADPATWWVHPVSRVYDDPVRRLIRAHYHGYLPRRVTPELPSGRVALDPTPPGGQARPSLPVRRRLTCVLPATDRHQVAAAVAGFLERGLKDAELIVVDDGPVGTSEAIPDDPRFRWIHLKAAATNATKRNIGCAQAWGELVEHWDAAGPQFGHRRLHWERHPFVEDATRPGSGDSRAGDVIGLASSIVMDA